MKKLLKLFLVYSYITMWAFGSSISYLRLAKLRVYERETGKKVGKRFEFIWKEIIRNFKEGWKLWD